MSLSLLRGFRSLAVFYVSCFCCLLTSIKFATRFHTLATPPPSVSQGCQPRRATLTAVEVFHTHYSACHAGEEDIRPLPVSCLTPTLGDFYPVVHALSSTLCQKKRSTNSLHQCQDIKRKF